MTLLVVVCGPDGAGKSTLCEEFVNDGGVEEEEWELVHFSQPKDLEDGKRAYHEFLGAFDPKVNVVCDRFHDGEYVYAPLYRGYTADYLAETEDLAVNLGTPVLLVYVTASPEVIAARCAARGEDYVLPKDYEAVRANYREFLLKQTLPFVVIDTTELTREAALVELRRAVRTARAVYDEVYAGRQVYGDGLRGSTPTGNLRAEYAFVGQNPAKATTDSRYTRMWSYTQSGELFRDVLRSEGVYLNAWLTNLYFAETANNLLDRDQVQRGRHCLAEQLGLIRPRVVVALGNTVYKALTDTPIFGEYKVVKLEHPAHALRFHRPEQPGYSQTAMKLLLEGCGGVSEVRV